MIRRTEAIPILRRKALVLRVEEVDEVYQTFLQSDEPTQVRARRGRNVVHIIAQSLEPLRE